MASTIDIYRTAAVLIRQHGDWAALEAAGRADALQERGDRDGERVWVRVLAAVEELQCTERPEGVSQH
jgi:hypothetical protein